MEHLSIFLLVFTACSCFVSPKLSHTQSDLSLADVCSEEHGRLPEKSQSGSQQLAGEQSAGRSLVNVFALTLCLISTHVTFGVNAPLEYKVLLRDKWIRHQSDLLLTQNVSFFCRISFAISSFLICSGNTVSWTYTTTSRETHWCYWGGLTDLTNHSSCAEFRF